MVHRIRVEANPARSTGQEPRGRVRHSVTAVPQPHT